MKFSVLMSIYEKEKPQYFVEALESVLNQTVIPNEIVIIEDGKLTKDLQDSIISFTYTTPDYLAKTEREKLVVYIRKEPVVYEWKGGKMCIRDRCGVVC